MTVVWRTVAVAVALLLPVSCRGTSGPPDAPTRAVLSDTARAWTSSPLSPPDLPDGVSSRADTADDGSVVAWFDAIGSSGTCWTVRLDVPASWIVDGTGHIRVAAPTPAVHPEAC